jgi:hypothetical protein
MIKWKDVWTLAEYIERGFLISKLMEHLRKYPNACYSASEIILILNNVPTADVVEVKHGCWLATGVEFGLVREFKCSQCRMTTIGNSPYCPNCGAKMDLKEGAEE